MTADDRTQTGDDVSLMEFVLEVGNVAWWKMDCKSGAVRFHERKSEMLGYAPERFQHYSDFTALLHPDDLQPAMQAMRDHLQGRLPDYKIDYRIKHKDGRYLWFQDVGRVSERDATGQPVTVTGIVFAITERKRVEAALREDDDRFSKLFHGHSAIKLVLDPATGSIIDANGAAANFYGWSIVQLQQMRIQQINALPPDEVESAMRKAASAPNARFEFRHRRADGSVRDVEVFSNQVEIAGKSFLYSIIHDISDRKQAEKALREAHDRLHRAEEFALFGHWEFALSDKLFRASDGALHVFGFATKAIPLHVVQDCVLPEYRPALDAALRDLIEKNGPYNVEFKIRRVSDGQVVDVHSRAEYDAANSRVFGVVQDISVRKRAETERENLILQLQSAVEHIKTLKGIVPICANCKKIRDDRGYWQQVEEYVSRHTEAQFSHGICPDCAKQFYSEL